MPSYQIYTRRDWRKHRAITACAHSSPHRWPSARPMLCSCGGRARGAAAGRASDRGEGRVGVALPARAVAESDRRTDMSAGGASGRPRRRRSARPGRLVNDRPRAIGPPRPAARGPPPRTPRRNRRRGGGGRGLRRRRARRAEACVWAYWIRSRSGVGIAPFHGLRAGAPEPGPTWSVTAGWRLRAGPVVHVAAAAPRGRDRVTATRAWPARMVVACAAPLPTGARLCNDQRERERERR
jgi:hypothetical protein